MTVFFKMPIRSAYSVFYFLKDLKVCMYYWEVECAHLCVSVFRYLCEVCVLPHLNPLVEESHVGEKCMWIFLKKQMRPLENQKEEKMDRSRRRRVYNERKGEVGRGFSCWETHQRSFPKFHSFFTISFFVSTFVLFFLRIGFI